MKKLIIIGSIVFLVAVGFFSLRPLFARFMLYKELLRGTVPKDTFSKEESLEEAWTRLAVNKNKKPVFWHNIQGSLLEEYMLGKIDEGNYEKLAKSYGLTADEANDKFYNDYIKTPDVAILARGNALSMSDLLQKKLYEPIRRFTVKDFTPDAIKDYPILIIPSAGLTGLENYDMLRISFAEYVERGGTLIVFGQPRGYLFHLLPVAQEPDGTFKLVDGYGWIEDQSLPTNGAYINTYHQIFAAQNKNTVNVAVDGYFYSYPSKSTVLLKKTSNGQAAMITYKCGLGNVIVTSLYPDYAFTRLKISTEELALIRDLIYWAKKPLPLPEVKPGDKVKLQLAIGNNTSNEAVFVKYSIYNPDRTKLLKKKILLKSIPPGQNITLPLSYVTKSDSPLGIHHIDYTLLDWKLTTIQPQAEADSGRFAVSNPPPVLPQVAPLTFSLLSNDEYYFVGLLATFTAIVFNNSNMEKTILTKYDGKSRTLIVPAKQLSRFDYSKSVTRSGWEKVSFYDENNNFLNEASKGYWVYHINVEVNTDEYFYRGGDKVGFKLKIENRQGEACETTLNLRVSGLSGTNIYSTNVLENIPENGTLEKSLSFALPLKTESDLYTVYVDAYDKAKKKIGGGSQNFEVK
jgi:hypothetical protein